MASCGIRVLTPELPGIKDYHVSQDSVEAIGESVKWFAAQTGGPVGVMGLSFSGGLALVAASEPQYHAAFKFVVAVGSQDSMLRVAEYYMTGRDVRPDGSVEALPPHEYGPLVLEYEHVDEFVPAADLEPGARGAAGASLRGQTGRGCGDAAAERRAAARGARPDGHDLARHARPDRSVDCAARGRVAGPLAGGTAAHAGHAGLSCCTARQTTSSPRPRRCGWPASCRATT